MLAVAGGKGGTGKTTTALGLAGALVARRRRPLVVDADVDTPNLHAVAGTPDSPGVAALAEGAPLDRVAHPADRVPGVAVIPATPDAAERASGALHRLPRDRPVLVDCPGGGGPDVAAPLRAADGTVVVTTATPSAVEDALKTAEMARALDAPVVAVAVVRADEPPAGLTDALDAPAVAVPEVDRPLAADAVRASYRRLATCSGPNGYVPRE